MKKLISLILFVLMVFSLAACGCEHNYVSEITKEATYELEGEMTYTCEKCGDSYIEPIEKLTRHIVPTDVLDNELSNAKYYNNPFSISVGKLVNSAMDNYKVKYYSGEEVITRNYLSKSQIDDSVDINNLYFAVISGDTMVNPEIPYMTEYESEAIKVWMIFDENDQLLNSNVTLCENLQTCAILLMTSTY